MTTTIFETSKKRNSEFQKQIVFKVSKKEAERFNSFCQVNRLKKSTLLRALINDCVDSVHEYPKRKGADNA